MMLPHWSHFMDIILLLTVWNAVNGHQDRWELDSSILMMPLWVSNPVCVIYDMLHFVLLIGRRSSPLFPHSTPQIPIGLFVLCLINDVCDTCVHVTVRLVRCVYIYVCACVEGEKMRRVCVYQCMCVFIDRGIYYLSDTTVIRKHCHLVVWEGRWDTCTWACIHTHTYK